MNLFDNIAFLDDIHVGKTINDCFVVGTIKDMGSLHNDYSDIFIALGNNQLRTKYIKQAQQIGYNLISLISQYAYVSKYSSIGIGTVIFPNVILDTNCVIGDGCIISANTTINHDAIIADDCLVYCNTVIRPNALIGTMSVIGNNCVVQSNVRVKAKSMINDGTIVSIDEYKF
ncbi:MAG: sialic acid O-acetyltransferase [Erysipelotrichaceae bacterium]|nr:sialic acid O-acetyltransferase [Erysipelotrichaceae bacterium]